MSNSGNDFFDYKSEKVHVNSVNKAYRDMNVRRYGVLFRLFGIALGFMLLVMLSWRLRGSDTTLTFTGFLDWLSGLNSVEVPYSFTEITIGGDWGPFDVIRNFLQMFLSVMSVVVWLFANLVNVCLYLVSFLQFLFLG